MAKSKVKKLGDIQRPINTVRNDFTNSSVYDINSTTSPQGKNFNPATGEAGSGSDIVQRNSTLARNLFTTGNRYTVDD